MTALSVHGRLKVLAVLRLCRAGLGGAMVPGAWRPTARTQEFLTNTFGMFSWHNRVRPLALARRAAGAAKERAER